MTWLDYTLFYKDGTLVTDIVKIKQIMRDRLVDIDKQLLLEGNGFEQSVVALVLFLYSGRGLSGIRVVE